MTYEFFEHRHRFAVWAAARATQRGFATVAMLRDALEASGVKDFVRDPHSLATDETAFDRHHRDWCRAIMGFLSERKLAKVTYGRAAKLVAVYLKSMVVLGPTATSSLASVAHPPIDRILLQTLASSLDIKSPQKSRWRTTNWTALDEPSYYTLVSQLKGVLSHGEPFWKLEQYWTVTDD